MVPIVGAIPGLRPPNRKDGPGGAAASASAPPTRRRSMRARWRPDPHHSAAGPQSFAADLTPVGIQHDAIRRHPFAADRNKNALDPLRGFFGTQQDPRLAAFATTEGAVEGGVLIRMVEHQPT